MQGLTPFDFDRDDVFKNYRFIAMIFLSSFVFIFTGCKEMRSEFGMMFEIRDGLEKKYIHDEININLIDGKFLTVNFINSPFNDLKDKEREEQAHEIALFTLSTIKKDFKVEKIDVAFSIHKKIYFIIDYTNTLNTFYFDVLELKKDLNEKQPDSSLQPDVICEANKWGQALHERCRPAAAGLGTDIFNHRSEPSPMTTSSMQDLPLSNDGFAAAFMRLKYIGLVCEGRVNFEVWQTQSSIHWKSSRPLIRFHYQTTGVEGSGSGRGGTWLLFTRWVKRNKSLIRQLRER